MNKVSIFDAHSHIQFPAYEKDRAEVIKRAQDKNIKMIAVGTQAPTSESAIQLAREYSGDIWATVGYHPNHVVISSDPSVGATDSWFHDKKEQKDAVPEKFDIEKLRTLALDPKVVAIGECGLDYYRLATSDERLATSIKDRQKEVFLKQAELAEELGKPLMMHCRPSKGTDDAYEDLLKILNPKPSTPNPIVHFYVGSLEITKKLVEAGFYFTFGGVITFARDYDEVIKYIPLDRILLETDCPYLAPQSKRGKRNEPAYILETAEKLAEIKNLDPNLVLKTIYKNTLSVFKI
ncbi:MAG: TatD family hydrolase [Candidatus Harrisonbacteria bacterium]|nr:TatD family hydrolase [Candidatus Harrisonbacteria bacterium]